MMTDAEIVELGGLRYLNANVDPETYTELAKLAAAVDGCTPYEEHQRTAQRLEVLEAKYATLTQQERAVVAEKFAAYCKTCNVD
jgi:hypothetical protein